MKTRYESAKELYAAFGVDTDAAIAKLKSIRCIAGRVTMLRALTMTVRLPAAFRQPVTIPERLKLRSSLWLIWIWQ